MFLDCCRVGRRAPHHAFAHRTVYKLFQKQVELGRLKLPDEQELQGDKQQPVEEPDPQLIARLLGTTGEAVAADSEDPGIRKECLQVWALSPRLRTKSLAGII